MARKKNTTKPTEATFTGPAGETTIPLYAGMAADLPAMWQVRLEDQINALRRSEIGEAEFMVKIAAIFTHLSGIPGNQRIDPKMLDRTDVDAETVRGLVQAGSGIMPYLTPNGERSEDGGEPGNA